MVIDGITVLIKEATEHRAVMVLRGENLSSAISDTDPKKEGLKIKTSTAKDNSKEAAFTADLLNKVIIKAHEILKNHLLNIKRIEEGKFSANCIVTRGAGKMPKIKKITEKLKFKACCVAAEDTVLGVANLAGFETIHKSCFTGIIDTNIEEKAKAAVEALKTNDLVVLHYNATDLMGHDNNPQGKVEAIEKYDNMLKIVLDLIKEEKLDDVIIALAADHSTPCERKEHSGDPVPVLINGKSIRKDYVEKYDEISCSQGGLNRI